MDTIIERLKKVKELADRGEAGEALAAKAKLMELLKKYNISLEDIETDITNSYKFRYAFSDEKKVMLQCISKVIDDPKMTYSHYKDKKKEFFVKLTEWQYIESMDLIKFHLKQYRDEKKRKMRALFSAYLNRHELFADSSEPGDSKMSPEEYADFVRAYEGLLDSETYVKKLPAKS
jgi:hypothetical protein